MDNINDNEIDQIKLFPPGAQKIYDYILSCNSLYFCYCTTSSMIIYERSSLKLKSIICPHSNYYLRTAALNKGLRPELAVFYNFEIIIYDLNTEKPRLSLPINSVLYLEFNTENKLLAVTEKGELAFFDLETTKDFKNDIKMIKTADKVVMAQWYPFTTSDIAYITNKNEVYYQSILTPNKISTIKLEITIPRNDNSFLITEMAWYDADDNYKYLIIGTNTSYIVLVDLNEKQPMIINAFDHYGNGIKQLLWLTYEPGSFISITKNCGRISTWNVSKSNYNHIIRLTDFAISSIIKYDNESVLFSTSKGEVVIYNMKQNKRTFYIDCGHCERIFDVKFNPLTYGIFATCSYDGSIKIWNMIKNELQTTLYLDLNQNRMEKSKDEMIQMVNVFCIKWSPNESHLLASGDSSSCAKIWDINKEKQIASIKFETKYKKELDIFGIDWGKDDLIVCGCQMTVFVNLYSNGKLLTTKIIPIEQSVFLIKFNPHEEKEIAVACKDGIIRAYKLTNDNNAPIKTYVGHKYKVFGLAFSTSIKMMASSSDDFKIGIWDLNKEEKNEKNFLLGHTDNVRSLLWLEHYPHIILSGSWDSTIRFWNAKQMICIGLINEHLSDVYGLDVCPNHPFLIISTARDNTIRLWNYSHHPLAILTDFDSEDSFKVKEFSFDNTKVNNSNNNSISNNKNPKVGIAELISKCYFYEDGIKAFWQMVHQITAPSSDSNSSKGLINEYIEYGNTSKEIYDSYFNNSKIDYSKRKEDILKELIDRCAKSGQWKQYCEYCIKLKDWESAIMGAPHVSKDYWRYLTNKYADYCIDNNFNRDVRLSSILLSDKVDLMIKELFERGDYEDAKLIWITRDNKPSIREEDIQLDNQLDINNEVKEEVSALLQDANWKQNHLYPILFTLAEKKLIEGNPLQASYHYLSIYDIPSAIKALVQSNQLETAFLIMKIFDCYLYEEDIIHGLYIKKKDYAVISELSNLLIQCNHLTTKVTLLRLILSKIPTLHQDITSRIPDEVMKSNDSLLQAIMNQNMNEVVLIINRKCKEFLSLLSLRDTSSSIINAFDEMIKVYHSIKGIDFDIANPMFFSLKIRLIQCATNMDIINNNTKGASCLMVQFIKILGAGLNNEFDDNDFVSLAFSYDYLKDNSHITEDAYWLSKESKTYIENILKKRPNIQGFNLDYYKGLQKAIAQSNDETTRVYSCEGSQYNKLYYIKSEDFPKNVNSCDVSSFSRKTIKNNGIKLLNGNTASLSEYLELFKYSCQ